MLYREEYSVLGFGCMRLPDKFEEAEQLILKAIESGINYYDTAYVYKGNEILLGKIMAKNNCRSKMKIATKLPVYQMKKYEDFERYFQTELQRLQTDYIDNYLMHMLPDITTWNRLIDMGIVRWLEGKKASGQIKHIGFSFHGSSDIFIELLNAYDWEFCQVQYNYMDENSQAGRKGVQAAFNKHIPVIIMEPLRGGSLTKGLNKKAASIFAKTGQTPAYWGLTWLYAQPEVCCVLSGMNTMEMFEENIQIASKEHNFSEEDFKLIEKVKDSINAQNRIPCTACRYCMPCPMGVDIPGTFRCYNVSYSDGIIRGETEYIMGIAMKEQQGLASQCVKCGKCEKHCPQKIEIRQELNRAKRRLENPVFKLIKIVTDRIYKH